MTETGDYEIIWNETLSQIRSELEEQEFLTWFNLEFQEADDGGFTISVPSLFYLDQVKRRYQAYIEGKIEELIGKRVALNLVIKPKTGEIPGNPGPPPEPSPPSKTPETPARSQEKPSRERHSQLRNDYTFETYVVGDNNSFAANAAQAIARNPGTAYNPFLIYGGAGLGKTHLMQAVGNYIHATTDYKVIYISAETFTNEFIASIQDTERAKAAFKNKYRFADILLIDDIHFLQKKDGTQEELFYTFNALYDANKQMVFTCDRPLSDLKDFNDRLRSRVGRGLNVDLQPPNYETRCAILKKKTEASGIIIPDDVIALVSKNISTNVRDLESALNTLTAYAKLVKKSITVEVAQQLLKDPFADRRQSNLSIDIIQRVVAEKFHLSPNDLKGKKRTQSIVYPRQLAMFIIREITEYTTTEIGQAFGGRDHTTVMHACQKIEDRINSDPSMDSIIQSLIRSIKDYSAKV
ncbi:MAG: chromosomal replication initiator protein DnaA [Spirochaetaceae bacterium]|jgi:chromosomal replication initiator protein|nr:chromosomal replication initiator protein DnaA [Spirochaetaceae bacterium]